MRSNGVEITVVPVHFALLSRAEALPEALEVSHRCHRRHHRMFRIQSFYSDDSPSIHTLTSRARTGEFHPMRDKVCLGNQMTCLSFHKQFRVGQVLSRMSLTMLYIMHASVHSNSSQTQHANFLIILSLSYVL